MMLFLYRIFWEGDGAGGGDAGVGDMDEDMGVYDGYGGLEGFEGGVIGGGLTGGAFGVAGAESIGGGGEIGEPGRTGLSPGGGAATEPVKLPTEKAAEDKIAEVEPTKKRKKRRPTILTADEDVLGVGTYGKRKRLLGE